MAASRSRIRCNVRPVSGVGIRGNGVGEGQCWSSLLVGLLGRDGGYAPASFFVVIALLEIMGNHVLKMLYPGRREDVVNLGFIGGLMGVQPVLLCLQK